MYNKDVPEKDDIVYWTNVLGYIVAIVKCKVVETEWDEDNEYEITRLNNIKNIAGKAVSHFIVDYPWQLQKTLEDAKRIAIIGIFKSKYSFLHQIPPWE